MIRLILLVLILIPMSALAEVTSTMIEPSRIAVQLYVFGEPAQKVAEPLTGVLASARKAGFENVQGWLSYYTSLEDGTRLSSMLEHEQLKMPCAYAGGAMHTQVGAESDRYHPRSGPDRLEVWPQSGCSQPGPIATREDG